MTEYLAAGFGLRLRHARPDDAEFIISLRTQDRALGNIGDTPREIAAQREWLEAQQDRANDVYFVAETKAGVPVGTVGFVLQPNGEWEVGRYVARPDTLAGSALAVLSLDWGLLSGRYPEVIAYVVVTNARIRKINVRLGFTDDRILPNALVIAGQPVDLLRQVLTLDSWRRTRGAIIALAERAESTLGALQQ